MLAFGNRQANRRKQRKASAGRRGEQAAYKTQLRIEPLEDRRLLSVLGFAVTNLNDGPVAQAGDLPGSLRQAIFDANANPGADTIGFDSSLSGGTIALTAGQLAITDSMTIEGLGAANLTIDAQGQSRIFNVDDGDNIHDNNVEIDGLTLTGGNASGTSWPDNCGGAILSLENLTARDLAITGNTAADGGGGIATETPSGSITTIQDSTVSGNSASFGGGIMVKSIFGYATIISNCTISGNTASSGGGGGIAVSTDSVVFIGDTTFSGNTAESGGAISTTNGFNGLTKIKNCTISENTVSSNGGGIYSFSDNYGATTIQNSTIFGNSASANGGGIAAIATNGGATTIVNSTVTGNLSDSDSNGAGAGGGIFAYSNSGTASVQSTIISGNGDNSGTAPDISGTVSIDHSLVGNNMGSGLTEVPVGTIDPSGNGNIIGDPNGQGSIDAGLNPLADNGGPTETCALAPTSPAIDRGSNPFSLSYDQRGIGFYRAFLAPDIGAYELNLPPHLSLFVDTLADENDGDYSLGHLSLREAVDLANANPIPDTISFDSSLDGGTIHLTLGELSITDSVMILGPGADNLTIDAGNHSRIFDVNDYDYTTNIDVVIDGLTLTGGNATGAAWPDNSGGAILSFDNLTLSHCTVEGNTAADFGGGILIEAFAGGLTTISASTISGNTSGGNGGGIWSQSYATTVIENSVISGNTSGGDGGGVYTRVTNNGTATIHGSTLSGNTAANRGGGIWEWTDGGATTIEDSTISANTSHDAGGGIWTEADGPSAVTIQGSTISGNAADAAGGGIWAYTGGASTSIQNSTISGNTAGGRAGGLYSNNYGTATLQNSTVTGNTSNDAGGGIYSNNYNGSYYSTYPLIIRSTIIAGNTDTSGTATDVTGQLEISTSLVGDNTGSGLAEAPVGGAAPGGTNNIVGDPNGHGVIDAKLGPLADNGGPTWTCALLAGSPAIDAGANPTALFYDQRGAGYPRDLGLQTDMGAFEFPSPDIAPPVATLDPNSVVVTASTATFTVTYTDPDDDDKVLLSSIDGNDILVTCPDGSHQYASLVSVSPSGMAWSSLATYQVNASGGAWSEANTGNFTLTMQAGQVSDTNNNFVVGGSLGTLDVEAWIPYVLPSATISVQTVQQDTTVQATFVMHAGQRIRDWGQVAWQGNTSTVDLQIEQTTYYLHPGVVRPPSAVLEHHDYDLGTLAPGSYTFNLTSYGQAVATAPFHVAGPVAIDRIVVAEATPQDGILESNEKLVITWAVNGADTVASKSLLVDGKAVNTIYGPYGPNGDGSYYLAGVFGPMSVGTHQVTIHSADSKGTAGDYSGQVQVVGPAISISQVVVAEASAPRNGILDTSDPLVITWAVKGADTVASRSLLIDGKAARSIYGPYGPQADGSYYFAGMVGSLGAGTHTYVIQSADSTGTVASGSGAFNVLPSDVKISNVVLAEAQTPRNGVIGTSESIVLTWAITGPAAATTVAARTTLTVDGKSISTKYGPYGTADTYTYNWASVFGPVSAGTHTYQINTNAGTGLTSLYTGTFKVPSAAYLTVDAAQPPQGSAAALSDSQLAPMVTEAERRWAAVGGAAAIAGLAGVKVEVADLPAGTLGEMDGKTILIDRDAAGYGWFVDTTPGDDSEFAATPGGPTLVAAKGGAAASRVDLLTTVMHELGHELGLDHVAADDLMNAVLPWGVRRNISGLDLIGSGSSEHNSVDQLFATIGA